MADQLVGVPDWFVVPIGGGGTAAAIWRGFRELYELGRIQRLPRLLGVVATGYDAIARALEKDVEDPLTIFGPGYDPPPTVLVKIAHVFLPTGWRACMPSVIPAVVPSLFPTLKLFRRREMLPPARVSLSSRRPPLHLPPSKRPANRR